MRVIVLATVASILSACHVAVGDGGPPNLDVLKQCERYLNGKSVDFPFGGPSVGVIAPGDIPQESKLRVSVNLPRGRAIRFLSDEFEVYFPGESSPLRDRAVILDGQFEPASSEIVEVFRSGDTLQNESDEEQWYFLSVFAIEDLPSAFVLRFPNIEVSGTLSRIPDVAFKFFADRNGLGICD